MTDKCHVCSTESGAISFVQYCIRNKEPAQHHSRECDLYDDLFICSECWAKGNRLWLSSNSKHWKPQSPESVFTVTNTLLGFQSHWKMAIPYWADRSMFKDVEEFTYPNRKQPE